MFSITLFGALLLGLSTQPNSNWVFATIGIAALCAGHCKAKKLSSAALNGFAAALVYFGSSLWWLGESFLEPGMPVTLYVIAGGFAALWCFIPFWFAAYLLSWRLSRNLSGANPALIFVGVLWFAELAMAEYVMGIPLGIVGYAFSGSAFEHFASIVGVHGLSLILLLFGAGLFSGTMSIKVGRFREAGMVAIITFALPCFASVAYIDRGQASESSSPPIMVATVQPNESWRDRIGTEMAERSFAALVENVSINIERGADVVILPESAVVTEYLDRSPDRVSRLGQALRPGTFVVIGGPRASFNGALTNWYNSLFVIDHNGSIIASYNKRFLVPFYEFMPSFFRLFGFKSMTSLDPGYTAGPDIRPIDISSNSIPGFIPAICYEGLMGGGLRDAFNRAQRPPQWIVNISNEEVFRSRTGPQVVFDSARFRSIETGLPMVRSVNTGHTAVISPSGVVERSIRPGVAGDLLHQLPRNLPPTFYTRLGDAPSMLFALVLVIGSVGASRKTKA